MGVILFGLLHGINPSHGWIVAVLYSIRKKRQIISSLISSGIIAGAHFLSSIVVVMAFIFVTSLVKIGIPQSYLNYGVTIALGILAYMFWKEKSEDLTKTQHGHLHDNISISTQNIEHEHEHWHKESGMHSHLHLHEKDFVKIQKDRIEEIKTWTDKMKEVKKHEHDVKVGIVAANNHYGAFGLRTLNLFIKCSSYHIFH